MTFLEKLEAAVAKNNSLLSVGLDPDESKLPAKFKDSLSAYSDFCKAIVDATAEYVCAFKPNSAFFEARGAAGVEELRQVCDYIQRKYPTIPIILDAKRGDIGNTNEHYAKFVFDYLGADALTVQPYQGREALQPFLDRKDNGIIVLCKTSNEGSGELQDLEVDGQKLYLKLAANVKNGWNTNGNCLLVTGATYPEELADIRKVTGDDMWFLVPGVGAQGGDIEAILKAGGEHLVINSARAIIFASNGDDFTEAVAAEARKTRDEINKYRSN